MAGTGMSRMVALALLLGASGVTLGGQGKVDLTKVVQETQRMSQSAGEMTLVWWIPDEFWEHSLSQDPSVTSDQIKQIVSTLSPYTIVAVVDGKMGAFGGITYRPETEIRSSLKIVDGKGITYQPLDQSKIDGDTKNLLAMIRPVIVNMLGPMGQNFHFVVFPGKDSSQQKIADAKSKGSFTVRLGQRQFRWRLPLGSLMPPKPCPKCKEQCSGAWEFCPWCGTKLSTKPLLFGR